MDVNAAPSFAAMSPRPVEPRFLAGILHLAWRHVAGARPDLVKDADPEEWIGRAAEVVEHNIASGRFAVTQECLDFARDGETSLLGYAEQVLVELLAESDRLARLTEGDVASWGMVIERMERLAYHWLGPIGREEWAAWEARDAAAYTCADLWAWLQAHPYPFDVPFNRWSARALNNRLHEAARKRHRRELVFSDSLDRPIARWQGAPTVGECFADTSFDDWLEHATNREALLQALDLLDERSATVLRLWYLEQWPADEIAAHVGKPVGYVYVLRFRSVEKLRKVVLENERLGLVSALHLLEREGHRSRPASGGHGWEEDAPS